MTAVQRTYILTLSCFLFLGLPAVTLAQVPTNTTTNTATITATYTPTNTRTQTPTATASRTATNSPTITATHTITDTPTLTATRTLSNTPTDSGTPTFSFTPNPTLTPPCGASAHNMGVSVGSPAGQSSDTMRASMFNLSVPATVYSLWLESDNPGIQVMAGIYSGSAGNIGSLVVSSAPQTALLGWNGISIPPTYLGPGNYWLAYCYNTSGAYEVYNTTSAAVSALAFTSGPVTFGTMPTNMPATVAYDGSSATPVYSTDSIYAVYCDAPTNTPTPSNTPTFSNTPTLSPTATLTFTPTNTGTVLTNTPSPTNTLSPTNTPTVTNSLTLTNTPNPSLTPDCGAAAVSFGEAVTTGLPQTVVAANGFRACRYTLTQSGTVETMSLYLPPQDAGLFYVETALYANNAATTAIANLLAQSTTQISTGGWNYFPIPATGLTPGDYWLAYIFDGPVSALAISPQVVPAENNSLGYFSPISSFTFPANLAALPASEYGNSWHEPILANYCPGTVNTSTPTSTPTSTTTFTPTITGTILTSTPSPTNSGTLTATPNLSLTPDCGVSALFFGSTNITPTPIYSSAVAEMWASRYTMPSNGTVETISLYVPPSDAGYQADVALFTNNSATTTMGTLVNQSGPTPQSLSAGWNVFPIPDSPVTAGDYWLAYIFSSYPVTAYSLVYQTSVTQNSEAYAVSPPSWTYPVIAATMIPTYTSGSQPIYANYCPGSVNSATPTHSPTATATPTRTNSPVNTATATLTGTPTFSATFTVTGTSSGTGTATPSATITPTPTLSPTPTQTGTPTNSETLTLTFTITNSPTVTLSLTPTGTPTVTATNSSTFSPTFTPTATLTGTPTVTVTMTNTPNLTWSPTFTPTSTYSATPTSTPSLTPTASSSSTPSGTFTATYSATSSPVFQTSTPTPTFTTTGTVTPILTPSATVSMETTPILYPNPLKGPGPVTLSVSFGEPHDYVTVKVFTTAFRKVYENRTPFAPAGLFNFSLDPGHFTGAPGANGLYYVVITTPTDRWISKLLILK